MNIRWLAPNWLLSIYLAFAYVVTGYLGLMLSMFETNITLIWLPTGISVGMLFRYGYGCWPGVALGAFLTNLANGSPIAISLGITCGNTLGPIFATYLLHRLQFEKTFARQHDILILSVSAMIGMIVTATLGVCTLSLAGVIQAEHAKAWFIWWAGDTMGIIAAAPILLVMSRMEMSRLLQRRSEFAIWFVVVLLVSILVFVVNGRDDHKALPITYLPLPLMVWAAMRLGASGTSTGIILLSVIAAYGISRGSGPFFTGTSTLESVLLLSSYMTTCAVLGWLVRFLNDSQRQSVALQNHLERAMNDASLGVLLTDENQRITYANAGFERLTGYTSSAILGKNCSFLQGPRTDPATIKAIKTALRGNGDFSGEILNYNKDGTTFWNELLISPVHDETGKLKGFLGVQQDVTNRKLAEASLKKSELRFRTLTNHTPVGIFTTDQHGHCTFVNPRWASITGLSVDAAKGIGWTKALHSEDRDRVFREMQESVESGNEFVCDHRFERPDGSVAWVQGTATALRDELGNGTGYVGTITDLTELFRAREVLRIAEERQRLALDAAMLGTWKIELDSEYIQLDEQSRKIFGLNEATISRDDGAEQIHPEDRERVLAQFTAAYQLNGPRSIASEYRILWGNGEVRWVSIRAKTYFIQDSSNATPSHVIGAVRDITESRNAESRIRASLREKEAMLKEIHHRVKNNLQIVTSLLNLQAVGNLSPDNINLLQETRNRVRSMALVHEDLYGSADFGHINLTRYMAQLCRHLLRSYGVDPSRIHLNLQIADVSLSLERAIPFGLIVNELLSNSLKYAFPDGRSGSVSIRVDLTTDRNFSLTISDDGIGLPRGFHLQQLKSLGLQLVSDLSVQLSGSLSFSSKSGTEFKMAFPVDNPE